jgi:hypothetical protein
MPKRPKDFTYYADKAEEQILNSHGQHTAQTKDRYLQRAELYVRLAAAAPKAVTTPEPRFSILTEAEAQMIDAAKSHPRAEGE